MIWTLIQLLALGFALGVGQRFALWVPGAYRRWRDFCPSCQLGFGHPHARLYGRPCQWCREAGR